MLQSATLKSAAPSSTRPEIAAEPYSVMVAAGREWEHEIDELRIASYRTAGYFKLPEPGHGPPAHGPRRLVLPRDPTRRVAGGDRPTGLRARARRGRGGAPGSGAAGWRRFPFDHAVPRGHQSALSRTGSDVAAGRAGRVGCVSCGIRSAIGMQADGTPHFEEMTRAGWQCRDVATHFARSVSFETPTMKLVYLRKARMADSIEHSKRRHANTIWRRPGGTGDRARRVGPAQDGQTLEPYGIGAKL
jgi:hypothetical protein